MESNQRVSELLVKTGAFTDLDTPVILASGVMGIYYVNTEKLLQDNNKWKEFGNDSHAMIQHAINITNKNPEFGEVIDILSEKVNSLFPKTGSCAISGGQRRDWIFSGPVAAKLNMDHISIYKDGKIEILPPNDPGYQPNNSQNKIITDLSGRTIIHIPDMLTAASSCYRLDKDNQEKGWIPEIRKREGITKNLVSVVSRLQGGEGNLAKIEVNAESLVAIGPNFLQEHSTNPKRAIEYKENPEQWTKNYLIENGALALIDTFNPNGGKIKRAKIFLEDYGTVLTQVGKARELNDAVKGKYNVSLTEISRMTD